MPNEIKKIAEQVKNSTPKIRQGKSNRNFSAAEPQYTMFMKYCHSKGISTSDVINQLVAVFMKEIEDDLPVMPGPTKLDEPA